MVGQTLSDSYKSTNKEGKRNSKGILTMNLDIVETKEILESKLDILNNGMTKIEIEALGRLVHAREIQVPEPPFDGNGRTMTILRWDKDSIERAINYLKPVKEDGNDVLLIAHASPWVTLAIADGLSPYVCYQFVPAWEMNLPFMLLPRGVPNPEAGVFFKITEENDFTFIYYEADIPDGRGTHNFSKYNLFKLVLPEVPSGKHICLYGHGIYPVQAMIAYSYGPGSRSVATASYEEEEFRCGLSSTKEFHPGDIVANANPYILRRPYPLTPRPLA